MSSVIAVSVFYIFAGAFYSFLIIGGTAMLDFCWLLFSTRLLFAFTAEGSIELAPMPAPMLLTPVAAPLLDAELLRKKPAF